MLVKKKNPEWIPSENKSLKVGETIDITNPRELILNGDVVGLDDKGQELSPYELYGIITKDERKDFEEWLKIKQQTAYKESLEEEADRLRKEVDAIKTEKVETKKK